MIPEIIKKFEQELLIFKKTSIKIKAKPIKKDVFNDPLGLKQSKFLGLPFFPLSKPYPKDKEGKPMIMISQINFSEIPPISNFPTSGILQLFVSGNNWYDDDYKIFFHKPGELEKENINDFSFLSEDTYAESPVYRIHKLYFEKAIENGGFEDSTFNFSFDGKSLWEFAEDLNEEEELKIYEYFNAGGHKLGGYADFTQSDPRDYESSKKDDIQVLQIDSDDYIMFGDAGLGHIFISNEYLKKKEFDKAYFYWDCC